ncbi:MAG TPA: indole-3-glycerol phosphate synthase TrpC [Phototrophicaceae bacterium]|nr:indole-3-glycerol phosphate synthase TrpC [Phototrophicaceae bacterium]
MKQAFVKTDTILDKILAQKALDVMEETREPAWLAQTMHYAQHAPPPRDFLGALRRETVALIAEVKKASPSKGVLVENFDPVRIGKTYADNGAAAISVLTDAPFFQGSLQNMRLVREAVAVPVLRKDFIIDSYQVYEGRAAGADAMLLIVMALEDQQLADLHSLITGLGMAALVEVHNEAELERALKIGAKLIGVNNRDLRTFHEDLTTTARVAKLVPPDVTLVAESAIRSAEDVYRMGELGAHAVLVGESLVKADNSALRVQEFSRQPREVKKP